MKWTTPTAKCSIRMGPSLVSISDHSTAPSCVVWPLRRSDKGDPRWCHHPAKSLTTPCDKLASVYHHVMFPLDCGLNGLAPLLVRRSPRNFARHHAARWRPAMQPDLDA